MNLLFYSIGLITFSIAFFFSSSFITSNKEVAEIFVLSLGVFIAFISILTHRRTEKLKATLKKLAEITSNMEGVDVLRFLKENENDSQASKNLVQEYETKKITLKELDNEEILKDKKVKLARQLYTYLNLLEEMSKGIFDGIYNEKTCKDIVYHRVKNGWADAKDFIEESRKTDRIYTLYQELELLVKRWDKNPIKKKI